MASFLSMAIEIFRLQGIDGKRGGTDLARLCTSISHVSKGASAHTWSGFFGVCNLQVRAEGVEDARNARKRNVA